VEQIAFLDHARQAVWKGATPACLLSISQQKMNEDAYRAIGLDCIERGSDPQENVSWHLIPWRGYLSIGLAEPIPKRFQERARKEREDFERIAQELAARQLSDSELRNGVGCDDYFDLQERAHGWQEEFLEVAAGMSLAKDQMRGMGVVQRVSKPGGGALSRDS